MKTKRFLAKILDVFIFYFLAIIFASTVMTFFMESFINLLTSSGFDFTQTGMNVDSLVYMQNFFRENLNESLIMVTFINVTMILFAFIYFGLIGKKLSGSPGKYLFHIGVEAKEEKNIVFKLVKREPIVHMLIITYIFSLLSLVFGFVFPVMIFHIIYIHLMVVGKDKWNDGFSFFLFY